MDLLYWQTRNLLIGQAAHLVRFMHLLKWFNLLPTMVLIGQIVRNLPVPFLLVVCFTSNSIRGDSSNGEGTIRDALRNNSNTRVKYDTNGHDNNGNDRGEQENVLKYEAQKMLKPCGVEKSNDTYGNEYNRQNNYEGSGTRNRYNTDGNRGYNTNANRNRGQYGGSWNNDDDDDEGNSEWGSSTYNRGGSSGFNSNNQRSYGHTSNNRYGSSSNMGDESNFYGSKQGNHNQRPYGNGQSNDKGQRGFGMWYPGRGYQSSGSSSFDVRRPYGGYNNKNEDCPEYGGPMFGVRREMNSGHPRRQRSSYFREDNENNEDDNQCVSQCVFGYMHLLDDERSPSETLIIKYLQEHVLESDLERIKALRDARRCFATLTASDIEDGCEFSAELSKCLQLELE